MLREYRLRCRECRRPWLAFGRLSFPHRCVFCGSRDVRIIRVES